MKSMHRPAEDEMPFDSNLVLKAFAVAERDGTTPAIAYFDATVALEVILHVTMRDAVEVVPPLVPAVSSLMTVEAAFVAAAITATTMELDDEEDDDDSEGFDAQGTLDAVLDSFLQGTIPTICYFDACTVFKKVWHAQSSNYLSFAVPFAGSITGTDGGNAFDAATTLEVVHKACIGGTTPFLQYFDAGLALEYVLAHHEEEYARC